MFKNYASRRFLLTCTTQVISSWLLFTGHLTSDAYSMIVIATVGAYIAGGTYQNVKEAKDAQN